jgi:hypothetical protein
LVGAAELSGIGADYEWSLSQLLMFSSIETQSAKMTVEQLSEQSPFFSELSIQPFDCLILFRMYVETNRWKPFYCSSSMLINIIS